MEETRSEIWAGIVMIIAGIIVVTMVMMVGKYADFYLTPRKEIVVYLNKVHGVKVNDPVRYAGMDVGQVIGVTYDQQKGMVKLTMAILADKILREDTAASVEVSMMGIASVEISPGKGEPIEQKEGEGLIEIAGKPTSTLQDVADKAGSLIDNLRQTFGEEQRKQFQEIITNVRDASANAREMVAKLKEMVEENRADLRSIIKHADKTMTTLDQITSENRDAVAKTIRNIEKASEQLDEVFAQLDKGLKGINEAIADAKKFVGKTNLLFDENREKINDALRNVKDVTANLQIMSQDLRRHPWKLLNKPTEKEIVTSDVADATDQSAVVAKDLDGHLEQLLQAQDRSPTDPKIKELVAALKEAIELLRKNQADIKKMLQAPAEKK